MKGFDRAEPAADAPDPDGPPAYPVRVLAMVALGLPGILAVGVAALDDVASLPGIPELSTPSLLALVLLQPTILLVVAAAVGVALAPRVGLRSRVLERLTRGTPVASGLRTDLRPRSRWASSRPWPPSCSICCSGRSSERHSRRPNPRPSRAS